MFRYALFLRSCLNLICVFVFRRFLNNTCDWLSFVEACVTYLCQHELIDTVSIPFSSGARFDASQAVSRLEWRCVMWRHQAGYSCRTRLYLLQASGWVSRTHDGWQTTTLNAHPSWLALVWIGFRLDRTSCRTPRDQHKRKCSTDWQSRHASEWRQRFCIHKICRRFLCEGESEDCERKWCISWEVMFEF